MTIVKAQAAAGILRFRTAPMPIVEEVAPPPPDPRIAILATQVADLEADLAAARRDAIAAVEAAREEGAREVLLDDRERLDAVTAGLETVLGTWRDRLADTERLAVAVARAAVERMFGAHEDLSGLVTRSAAAYVARIGAEAVVALRVSPLDFPEPGALACAARSIGLKADALSADPALSAGSCRADLRLGGADLDLAGQWSAVERLLDEAGPPLCTR